MARPVALVLLIASLAAGCTGPSGDIPSLQTRAAESMDPRIPVERPLNDRPAEPALVARLGALVAEARAGEARFAAAIEAAERAADGAGAPQTESWIVAQEALSGAVEARGAAAVALGAIDSVRHAAEAKGVRLETQLGPDVTIVCDPTRVQQVIWNLLSNAIKFTPPDGRVLVTTQPSGDRARVTVTDSGSGISPEFLPYVFERFRQEDGAATREHAGLGLGLSIVRHVVELHGGQVTARSDGEGKGACFVVELPIQAVAAEGAGVTEAAIAPPAEQAAR